MTKLASLSLCLALTSCAAATVPPATAGGSTAAVADSACSAGNYRYLVGRPTTAVREITDRDYRLAVGTVAATRADRVTVVYSPQSQRITEIRCG